MVAVRELHSRKKIMDTNKDGDNFFFFFYKKIEITPFVITLVMLIIILEKAQL